jgi:opacity protein-like surface antigen
MMRKLVLATVAVIAPVVLASSAVAQEQATLVLRSGQRVSGSLIDLNRSGFTVRVSGDERKFEVSEVARVEFSGDANLPSGQWKGGDHAFVLTDGSVVHGRLYDIGGRNPLRISVDTASGRREFSSNEIRAIHFVNPSSVGGGTGTSGSNIAVPEGAGIAVPANQQWVDSGIIVRQGQRVRFSARGEAQLSTDAKDRAIPQGSLTGRRAPNAPLPQELAGALLARVGTGQPFAISNAAEVTISDNGRLMLGINDDVVTDNQGGYRVEVTPQAGRR